MPSVDGSGRADCTRCASMERALRRSVGIIGSACELGADRKVRGVVIAESLRVSVLEQAARAIGVKVSAQTLNK